MKFYQSVKRLSVSLAVASVALSGSLWAAEPTAEEFNAAFTQANDARKMAAEMNHEWRDTAKLLKSAQESAAGGDLVNAMKLVAQAQMQSDQAIVQAEREATLWESRVIR